MATVDPTAIWQNPLVVAVWRFVRVIVAAGAAVAVAQTFAAIQTKPGMDAVSIANIFATAFIAGVIAACGDYIRVVAEQKAELRAKRGAPGGGLPRAKHWSRFLPI